MTAEKDTKDDSKGGPSNGAMKEQDAKAKTASAAYKSHSVSEHAKFNLDAMERIVPQAKTLTAASAAYKSLAVSGHARFDHDEMDCVDPQETTSTPTSAASKSVAEFTFSSLTAERDTMPSYRGDD